MAQVALRRTEILESLRDQPPFPDVAARTLRRVLDRETTAADLARVVSRDQTLTEAAQRHHDPPEKLPGLALCVQAADQFLPSYVVEEGSEEVRIARPSVTGACGRLGLVAREVEELASEIRLSVEKELRFFAA